LAKAPILQPRCPTPTCNVSLPKELDRFVTAKVEAGSYANASEVMRTALRLLEREEREYDEKMSAPRAAIAEGDACGDAEEGVFERLYVYIDAQEAKELVAGKDEDIAKVQCL
jgi:antitoxin ParD1/3/4